MERASKRARSDSSAEGGAGCSSLSCCCRCPGRQLGGEGPVATLPDEILVRVFAELGVQDAWKVRGVSKRWRRVIEDVEWIQLRLELCRTPAKLDALAALARRGKIRLASGSRLDVRIALAEEVSEQEASRLVGSYVGVLGTLSASLETVHTNFSQHVSLDLSTRRRPPLLSSLICKSFALGTLAALRPAGPTFSSLRNLKIGVCAREWTPSPAELQAALAPFSALISLDISYTFKLDAAAAAAIVERCPALKSLHLEVTEASAVASLAPLAALEVIELRVLPWTSPGLGEEFGVLASGPAGRSLRSLSLRSMDIWPPGLSDPVARMPRLECLKGLAFQSSTTPEAFVGLGAVTSLRELQLVLLLEDAEAANKLQALTDAVTRLTKLAKFELALYDCSAGDEAVEGALLRLLIASRRSLVHLILSSGWSLTLRIAEELASGCSQLESVGVHCKVTGVADVFALQTLADRCHRPDSRTAFTGFLTVPRENASILPTVSNLLAVKCASKRFKYVVELAVS